MNLGGHRRTAQATLTAERTHMAPSDAPRPPTLGERGLALSEFWRERCIVLRAANLELQGRLDRLTAP